MGESLYPILGPGISSPWGMHTWIFLVATVVIIVGMLFLMLRRNMYNDITESIPQKSFSFDERKVRFDKIMQGHKTLSTNQFVQKLYLLLLEGTQIHGTGNDLSSDTLHEIYEESLLTKKEKELFGMIYTPVFINGERTEDRKNTAGKLVLELVSGRRENFQTKNNLLLTDNDTY